MNSKLVAGLSALTFMAGLALPTVSQAWEQSERHELKQAKESVKFTKEELLEAWKDACRHHDDQNYCNHIYKAYLDACETYKEICEELQEAS